MSQELSDLCAFDFVKTDTLFVDCLDSNMNDDFIFAKKSIIPDEDVTWVLGNITNKLSNIYTNDMVVCRDLFVERDIIGNGNIDLTGNIDMKCENISNVQSLSVGNILPKDEGGNVTIDTQVLALDNAIFCGNVTVKGILDADVDANIPDPLCVNEIQTNTISGKDSDAISINANIDGDLTPSANLTGCIGTAEKKWLKLFVDDLDVCGNATFGISQNDCVTFNAKIDSDIIPKLNETYDLGSQSMAWDDIFVDYTHTNKLECYNGSGKIIVYDSLVPNNNKIRNLGEDDKNWNKFYINDVFVCGNVFGNVIGDICGNITARKIKKKDDEDEIEIEDKVRITDTTSTELCDTSDGALVVDGGLAVAGNVSVGGKVSTKGLYIDEDTVCLNFEGLAKGDITAAINSFYEDCGVTFSLPLIGGVGTGPLMIFDSSDPGPGDLDLGTPNSDFGGPGVGTGGQSGQPGENKKALGKILIISKDGNASEPCDNPDGGIIRMIFDREVEIISVDLLDVEDTSTAIKTYNSIGGLINTTTTMNMGNNGYQRLSIGDTGVTRVDIELSGSSAVSKIVFKGCKKALVTTDKVKSYYGCDYSCRQMAEDWQTETGTSFVTKDAFTPIGDDGFTGKYRVGYHCELNATVTDIDAEVQFRRVDGTPIEIAMNEHEAFGNPADEYFTCSGFYFMDLDNETPRFDCRLRSTNHGDAARVRRIRWEFMRVQ